MRYIEKNHNAPFVVAYERELKQETLDPESLSNLSIHPNCRGPEIYDMVKSLPTFKNLTQQLLADQGGICCYCGCKLAYPTHPQYIVEHVHPKDDKRELAGEYDNLLLSCRPSEEEERARLKAPKKIRKSFFHCDKSKGNSLLNYTPLQSDCSTHYTYSPYTGEVELRNPQDVLAQHDLDVLNLNCTWLTKRRLAAIEGFIYDDLGNLLPDDELRELSDSVMLRDKEGRLAEYCFVIQNALERLLE